MRYVRKAAVGLGVCALAVAGAVSTATGAQATDPPTFTAVEAVDECDGTLVTVTAGSIGGGTKWYGIANDDGFVGELDVLELEPGEFGTWAVDWDVATNLAVYSSADDEVTVDDVAVPFGDPLDHTWTWPGADVCGTPDVTVESDTCASVVLAFENPTPFVFSGDVRVDGEAGVPDDESPDDHGVTPFQEIAGGVFAGELFGLRYQPVPIPEVGSATWTGSFEDGSGVHTIEYRIWRGAENDWYVPWAEVTVDCGTPASPDPDTSTSPSPDVSASPEPGGQAGGGEQLPLTGVSGATVAGGAALGTIAVAGGLALTWWLRRRPVTFTTPE